MRTADSGPWMQCFLLFAGLLLTGGTACAEDWPHWRGPRRDGTVREDSGYDRLAAAGAGANWPAEKPAWQRNVGQGSSSPLVVDGQLFALGWREQREVVQCLGAATGELQWDVSYSAPLYGRHATGDQGLYSGPSSTPEYDPRTGYLHTLGSDGTLACWDTRRRGEAVWQLNLYDQFAAPQRPKVGRSGLRDYGYTSSPLVHDEWLLVEVGAPSGNLMAFDKRTGRAVWSSESKSPAGHNGGPVPLRVEGVPCAAVHNFDGLLVVRLDGARAGQTVATYPWNTEFANNIATLAVDGQRVIMTSAYNHYKIACLEITLAGARLVWQQPLASKVCTPVVHRGHLYWAWQKVICLDLDTGELRWQGGRVGDQGSCVVTSDDRLIVWTNRGDLLLAETAVRSSREYRQLAARTNLFRHDAWPHVVLSGQRLYCKDREGNLACFDLRAPNASP
ncbi:MAG: PQQ-binding-like beta-propeller repeat protein [Pirellulaceae bacterium]|nr:PQQ-binding-like beta-propeller repeat protein [Pirellulaceae bacterium]